MWNDLLIQGLSGIFWADLAGQELSAYTGIKKETWKKISVAKTVNRVQS